jgi:hypothetical protein
MPNRRSRLTGERRAYLPGVASLAKSRSQEHPDVRHEHGPKGDRDSEPSAEKRVQHENRQPLAAGNSGMRTVPCARQASRPSLVTST